MGLSPFSASFENLVGDYSSDIDNVFGSDVETDKEYYYNYCF